MEKQRVKDWIIQNQTTIQEIVLDQQRRTNIILATEPNEFQEDIELEAYRIIENKVCTEISSNLGISSDIIMEVLEDLDLRKV